MNIVFNSLKKRCVLSLFPHAPPPPNPRGRPPFSPLKTVAGNTSFARPLLSLSHDRAETANPKPSRTQFLEMPSRFLKSPGHFQKLPVASWQKNSPKSVFGNAQKWPGNTRKCPGHFQKLKIFGPLRGPKNLPNLGFWKCPEVAW